MPKSKEEVLENYIVHNGVEDVVLDQYDRPYYQTPDGKIYLSRKTN